MICDRCRSFGGMRFLGENFRVICKNPDVSEWPIDYAPMACTYFDSKDEKDHIKAKNKALF